MGRKKKKQPEHADNERWLVSYADFVTLLFATFTALFGISQADLQRFKQFRHSVREAFNNSAPSASVVSLPTVISEGGAKHDSPLEITIFDNTAPPPPSAADRSQQEEQPSERADLLEGYAFFSGSQDGIGEGRTRLEGSTGEESLDDIQRPNPTPTPTPTPRNQDNELSITPEGLGDEALARELRDLIETAGLNGEVEVRQEKRGMVISLGEAAFFAPGETEVLPQCRHKLDKIVNVLRDRGFQIRVEGHTDDTPITSGRYRSNLELSTLRASRIVEFMIYEYQFPPDKLSSAGYGPWRPVASNETEEGRQRNRRVDLVVLNEELAAREP